MFALVLIGDLKYISKRQINPCLILFWDKEYVWTHFHRILVKDLISP